MTEAGKDEEDEGAMRAEGCLAAGHPDIFTHERLADCSAKVPPTPALLWNFTADIPNIDHKSIYYCM